MNKLRCLFEKASDVAVAVALGVIALGFGVIGVTVLPVIGLLLAVPVAVAAFIFAAAPQSKDCALP